MSVEETKWVTKDEDIMRHTYLHLCRGQLVQYDRAEMVRQLDREYPYIDVTTVCWMHKPRRTNVIEECNR